MRWVLWLLCLCIGLLAAGPGLAGGAWPRGQGHFFGSVTWSSWGNLAGYLDAIQEPQLEPLQFDVTEEVAIYVEYGVNDRITLGLDHYHRPSLESSSTIFYARSNVGALDWSNKFAVELGAGTVVDYLGVEDSVLRVGLAWGRGFETRWSNGWVDVDAKFGRLWDSESTYWKVDSTIGLNPSEKSLWYLQLQSGAIDDFPTYTRAVPTYVRQIWRGLSLESALLWGLENDDSQGVKVGLWSEF